MRAILHPDEWYPYFSVQSEGESSGLSKTAEVKPGTLRRWKKVLKQAEKVQKELGEAYDNAPDNV